MMQFSSISSGLHFQKVLQLLVKIFEKDKRHPNKRTRRKKIGNSRQLVDFFFKVAHF